MNIRMIRQQDLPFRFVYIDAHGEITKRCLVEARKSGIYVKGSQQGEYIEKSYRIDRIQSLITSDHEWNTCPYSEPTYADEYPDSGYSPKKSVGSGISAMFNKEKALKAELEQSKQKQQKQTKTIWLLIVIILLFIYYVL